MEINIADALTAGSRYFKWQQVGDSVTGPIVSVDVRQARQYGTDLPDHWPDGNPKLQLVVVVATDERVDVDDDGQRTVVVNLWGAQKRALVKALQVAGLVEPKPGMRFTAAWTAGAGGASDPRQYAYTVQAAPSPVAAAVTAPEPAAGVDVALQMLRAGVAADAVAKATGLDAAVVAALPRF